MTHTRGIADFHPQHSEPLVMGILNVTPDSFSDGGRYVSVEAALLRARAMLEEGADIIDVGGESTRPGADSVTVDEELARVIPVIEALRRATEAPVSVDTSKPEVMRAAAAAGASMINDVRALQADGAPELLAELGLPVCLMHMQGEPRSMQAKPHYDDVVREVLDFLLKRAQVCMRAGVAAERIVLDPGFGFGKTLEHNLALLAGLDRIVEAGYPVLAGLSRKSMIGALLGDPECDRLVGSVALALYAVRKGAYIVRVHDVRQTRQALRVQSALA
ncbi:MAG: dihydropteroate synthase [Gammaproteobacteria bacterium]|jgi:dihydropteroate synthase